MSGPLSARAICLFECNPTRKKVAESKRVFFAKSLFDFATFQAKRKGTVISKNNLEVRPKLKIPSHIKPPLTEEGPNCGLDDNVVLFLQLD